MKYIKLFETYNKSSEKFMNDLYNIGKTKAVGYLPYNGIKIYGNDTPENVIRWAIENNLEYKVYTEKDSSISTGALYVYDYDMLYNMLQTYKDILLEANVPLEPHAYIDYITKNIVYEHIYPLAYKVIGLTFNDKRFI